MMIDLKVLGAAALVAGGLGLATSASAAPAGPVAGVAIAGEGLVEHVAQGCGPGYFRGPRGFCRPMRGGFGGPPRYFGPRCYVRPTPFGPRRVCR